MNLILLGGNHIGNKKWIESVEKLLRPYFASTHIHYYRHWETGEEWIDLDYELEQVEKVAKKMEKYVIFARSAGTILTIKGNFLKTLTPQFCIFVGIAIKWAEHFKLPVQTWLKNYTLPTLIIQKSHDPAISYKELKKFLANSRSQNANIVEIPGDDHYYRDIELIRDLTIEYCGDNKLK